MGFGPADPLPVAPKIAERLQIDFIPEMQKASRDGFWEIHNDLIAVDVQIEGQLGHTLGGGKEKKERRGAKKELKTLEVCPQKRVPQPG